MTANAPIALPHGQAVTVDGHRLVLIARPLPGHAKVLVNGLDDRRFTAHLALGDVFEVEGHHYELSEFRYADRAVAIRRVDAPVASPAA